MTPDLASVAELIDGLLQPGADPRHPEQRRHEVATARMDDAQRGHPGSPSTAPGHSSDVSSPVERALTQIDLGGLDLERWNAAMRQLASAARTLDRLAVAWIPRSPSWRAQVETEAANVALCEHCGDDPLRANQATDVAGNLAEPVKLCWWCYKFVRKAGRLPDASTLTRRRKGQRIMLDA